MASINYIILAHHHPQQLHRLINRLDQSGAFFYVHIDKSVHIEPFLLRQENVFFCRQREAGTWGDWGIVKATVHALKQVAEDGRKGHAVLLSGQDYPIKPKEAIQAFFEKHDDTSFIDSTLLPHPGMHRGGFDRVEWYKYNLSTRMGDYVQIPPLFSGFALSDMRKLIRVLRTGRIPWEILFKRRHPYMPPAAGTQWFAFSEAAVKKVLAFLDSHPAFLRFHRHSLLPDELLFQSLALHLGLKTNPAVTYVNWEKHEGLMPAVFDENDREELLAQPEGKLFARKFEPDSAILDILDEVVHRCPAECKQR